MPRPLKILGVHGLGDHRTSDWKEKWSKTLTESFPAVEGLSLDCRYVTYDDLFEKTKLTAWECAKAFWKLTASGVSSIGRRERGVITDISDRIQWTAGYVVAWVEDEDFKRKSRKRILDAVRENQPDIILAHSLGSLITYDAFSHEDAREVEVRRILENARYVTLGSQIGNPFVVRNLTNGRIQPLDVAVLASPLQPGGRCLHGGNQAVGSDEFPADRYAVRQRRLRRSLGRKATSAIARRSRTSGGRSAAKRRVPSVGRACRRSARRATGASAQDAESAAGRHQRLSGTKQTGSKAASTTCSR